MLISLAELRLLPCCLQPVLTSSWVVLLHRRSDRCALSRALAWPPPHPEETPESSSSPSQPASAPVPVPLHPPHAAHLLQLHCLSATPHLTSHPPVLAGVPPSPLGQGLVLGAPTEQWWSDMGKGRAEDLICMIRTGARRDAPLVRSKCMWRTFAVWSRRDSRLQLSKEMLSRRAEGRV